MAHPSKFNFADPAVQECPYPLYQAMREHEPVFQVPGMGFYIVSRYEDIVEALGRPDLFSSKLGFRGKEPPPSVTAVFEEAGLGGDVPTLVSNDPPEHTRFRRLVDQAFTPKRVAGLEAYMVQVVNETIDSFIHAGQAEMVQQFCVPVPLKIIADQLGVSRDDMDAFKRWSDASVEPLGMMISEERHVKCAKEMVEFERYFLERIRERRARRTDDMLSDVVYAAHDVGEEPITDAELLSVTRQFLVAGNETTTNTLASAIWLLIRNPDQVRILRENPQLFGRLAEETLRFESPVQGLFRMTTADVELGGTVIPKGSVVNLRYGSGNRDACVFADPDKFDVSRADARKHLAFGGGIHLCIGQALARQEIKVAMRELLGRIDNLRFTDPNFEVTHHPSAILRGIKALPVSFDPIDAAATRPLGAAA